MLDEVNVDEDPAFADLGAGDLTDTCLFLQRHGMDVQERCSGLQIERIHVQVIRRGLCRGASWHEAAAAGNLPWRTTAYCSVVWRSAEHAATTSASCHVFGTLR